MLKVTVIVMTQTKGETDSQLLKFVYFTVSEDAETKKVLRRLYRNPFLLSAGNMSVKVSMLSC
jgi:hypothetical protein